MKKIFVSLILAAILLTCCACGQKETAAPTTTVPETTLDPMSPEAKFGHIDQTQPQDGVYQIWNAEGVQHMMGLTDGSIELLCDIDMAGATLAPMENFTGELNGENFTISNFTLQGKAGEDFGFVTVNKGNVHNLILTNVTFLPNEGAKNIGALAGTNEGTIQRCTVNAGSLAVTAAAENGACGAMAGVNTGAIANTRVTVDTTFASNGAACVGGLVGTAKGGTLEFLESHGKLTVTGEHKTVGLFAGEATDVVIRGSVFGGADNSLNGQLFLNFTGNADDDELVVAENALWRDNAAIKPLPENIMALRQKTVDAMHAVCTVPWKVGQDKAHTCNCYLTACHGVYKTGYTYYGIPYSHKSSSVARVLHCTGEDGVMDDWIYDLPPFDGLECYIGGDCSSTVQQAWWTVSNSTDILNTEWIPAAMGQGTISVGPYKCDFQLTGSKLTRQYIQANDQQTIFESYAAMRLGDIIVNRVQEGGHTRMAVSDPVIVRDQNGLINATYSYILCDENIALEIIDEEAMTITTCKTNYKYAFAELYGDDYIPVTCEELLTGEADTPEATLENAAEGYAGMISGTVRANYHLDYVKLTVVDENGNIVLDHPMFTTVSKTDVQSNYFTARNYVDWLNMADFAQVLSHYPLKQGGRYSYTVTAGLATYDQIVVYEGSFSYGA